MTPITRRTIIKTLSGISLGILIPSKGKASITEVADRKLNTINTDILIVGGGTAGVIAALQAARAGCSTILIENGSQLGGTTTTGGVSFPGLFHAWGKQVISGIGWELVNDTIELDDGVLPDFSVPTGSQHWKHQIRINPYIYTLLAEEKCLKAGVKLRYYETPFCIHPKPNRWEVETIGKGSHNLIICKQLIDCTGNASVTSLAGFPVLREQETQPGTLMFKIGGYDLSTLDFSLIEYMYNDAIEKGIFTKEEFRNIRSLLQSQGDNVQHIVGADSTTSETHTLTNINGRSSLLTHLRFLRTLPGCEKTKLLSMQTETGVRETFRIEGLYQITVDDYVSGKVFEDSVCYSFYPIDLHDKHGVAPKHLTEGTVPTIPIKALIPKNSQNILVAGRCISSDRLANSALRVQATCMAMGQAAGATAALACKYNTSPKDIPINQIRRLIKEHAGIVPD